MKKAKKLIILSVALALLIAVYAVISGLNADGTDAGGEDTSPESDQSYIAGSVDVKTLTGISYTYGGTEYSFTLDKDKDRWLWRENASLIFDGEYFASMAQAFSSLTSTVKYENITFDDLSKYGLDEPHTVITMTDEKNGKQTFRFGTLNDFNGQYYFTSDFTHRSLPCTVYMIDESVLEYFKFTPDDMLRHDVLPTVGKDKLIYVTVETPGSCCAVEFDYYKNGKASEDGTGDAELYVSVHGKESLLDSELTAAITEGICNTHFGELVTYDESSLSEYGLDEPTYITVKYYVTRSVTDNSTGQTSTVEVEESFALLVGDADESKLRYAMLEGSPYAYKSSSAILDTLITLAEQYGAEAH